MRRNLTVEECLLRACRLMLLADQADSYKDILLYEGLARDWRVLAGRIGVVPAEPPQSWPAEPVQAGGEDRGEAARPVRVPRFPWRAIMGWFR